MKEAIKSVHDWIIISDSILCPQSYELKFSKNKQDLGYIMTVTFSRDEKLSLDKERMKNAFGFDPKLLSISYDSQIQIKRCEKNDSQPIIAEAFLGDKRYVYGYMNKNSIYTAADFALGIDKHVADFDSWKYLFSSIPANYQEKLEELLIQSPPAIQREWVKQAMKQFVL